MLLSLSAIAIRRRDPIVLIATGNCEGRPSIVGCSKSNAFPPSGDFISRFAHSLITRSVSTRTETRANSPARSGRRIDARFGSGGDRPGDQRMGEPRNEIARWWESVALRAADDRRPALAISRFDQP